MPATGRTQLYRYFDEHADLLYVGITGNPTQRRYSHSRWSSWWRLVASNTTEWFDTREDARAAEIAAIAAEHPRFNRADTPDGRPGGPATVAKRRSEPADGPELDHVKAARAAYRRTDRALAKAQAALAAAVVAALRAGKRPADVARASEWDREYNRRLKKAADEADAAAASEHAPPA